MLSPSAQAKEEGSKRQKLRNSSPARREKLRHHPSLAHERCQCCGRQGRGKSQTPASPEKRRGKMETAFRKHPRKFAFEEAKNEREHMVQRGSF